MVYGIRRWLFAESTTVTSNPALLARSFDDSTHEVRCILSAANVKAFQAVATIQDGGKCVEAPCRLEDGLRFVPGS